ncbi:type II secretion system F family protein [Oribacterium sp. WCC10]|uniref:type II secretion system F family protein n=1 Tax=Oribacterium sp. WCC10 TaxID=1855343 RepID=UPI0008EA8AB3|nr:type II secretion system F family protein [Oribacterium sp. WCC10]SFG18713.1 type II secretion system protein F (GspF) [Oribacterium sp. WCC10]
MVTYSYKALTEDGIETKGVIQAPDEYTAVTQIKQKCPIVVNLRPVDTDIRKIENILTMEVGSPRIKTRALALMCSQFAITLQAGMPVGRAIDMIAKQTEDKKLHKILTEASEDVLGGSSLTTALERYDEAFPITFLETIRAGEVSGTLENSFARMHKYYETSARNSEKIRSALTYPIFVVCIAVIVLIIIMVKVIPALAEVFSSLGGDLPLMTRIMIDMANFFADWWVFILIVVILLLIGWKIFTKTERGMVLEAELALSLPVIGRINVMSGSAQFANTMATMLASGLTLDKSVSVTAKVLDNYLLQKDVKKMIGRIEEGKPVGECIKDCEYFPESLKSMCSVGEETGELDQTLEVIGDYFTVEAERRVQQAITMLEPTLLVVMAIFAGFLVISIYLPMFTMYNLF